jgi:hypothetical protein
METRWTRPVAAAWAVAVLFVLSTGAAYAQSAAATLTGVVTDESGAAVPGASVTVRNTGTGASRRALTDAAGRYSLPSLDPGDYELRIELVGFKTVVRGGVGLRVGGSSAVDVTLSPRRGHEHVVRPGEGAADRDDQGRDQPRGETQEIETLPNIGRNFVDFVKLSSAVAPGRENVGGRTFQGAGRGRGRGRRAAASPSAASRSSTRSVQVDGADNVQTYTGLPRATRRRSGARVPILQSTYAAEYGRALGGFVNIVTKSGTNEPHGSVYYYGMDDGLASPSILNAPGADQLSQHQYGAFFGGPLRRTARSCSRATRGSTARSRTSSRASSATTSPPSTPPAPATA